MSPPVFFPLSLYARFAARETLFHFIEIKGSMFRPEPDIDRDCSLLLSSQAVTAAPIPSAAVTALPSDDGFIANAAYHIKLVRHARLGPLRNHEVTGLHR
jgi:hypothetical protein